MKYTEQEIQEIVDQEHFNDLKKNLIRIALEWENGIEELESELICDIDKKLSATLTNSFRIYLNNIGLGDIIKKKENT